MKENNMDNQKIEQVVEETTSTPTDNKKTNKKKKTGNGKIKKSFKTQQFKSGAYSSFITVLVIALVVIVNLVFNKLDLSTDMSSGSLYTLSQDTKNIVKKTKDKITIYYMVQHGNEEDYIDRVINQYKKVGSNVKVVKKDPVVYPGFASKYVDSDISDNDVIVVDETTGAAKYVSAEDMYYTDSSSMYSGGSSSTYLDVEGRVTSAIQNVLSGENTKMYIVSGHGETEIGSTLTTSIEKMNVETESLELVTKSKIPSDCDILLINGPTKDLMDDEKDAILNYLKKGGNAILLTQYNADSETPNYDEILKYYGVTTQKGVICESSGKYYSYANWIIPTTNTASDIVSGIDGYIILSNAEGLKAADSDSIRSSVSITNLLTTSDKSYLKVDPSAGTADKESGDLDGPFDVGLYVEEKLDGDQSTKLVVYSTADAISDTYTSSSQLANASLLENAVSALSDSKVEETSIAEKSLSYSSVTLSIGSQITWAALIIIILPLGLLITGFAIWMVRRRK